MSRDKLDLILDHMRDFTSHGTIIVSVPDLMKSTGLSRIEITSGLAVLHNQEIIDNIPNREHFWYLKELHTLWLEAQDGEKSG
jgi:hypothetical protein